MTASTDSHRYVLISGANKGIGNAVAASLAEKSNTTVFMAARDSEAARRAAAAISERGGDARGVQLDVTQPESIAAAVRHIKSETGRLDVLINNAGIALDGGIAPSQGTLDMLRATYEVNVFGVVALTQAAIPLLRESATPRIVNVTSGLGSLALRSDESHFYHAVNALAYTTSKTALNAVTVCFAQEFAEAGWKINAADPGYTATDLNQFSGHRTVEQAATVIVRLATLPGDGPTGAFFDENGAVPW